MQIALLSCYEALIDGLSKAAANLSALQKLGWGQPQYNALQQKLASVRAAEQALYQATANLDSILTDAQASLMQLSQLLVYIGAGAPQPEGESSFAYSISMSSSTSNDWGHPSGGVWVTDSVSYRVPDGCPCGSSSGSLGGAKSARAGAGPGPFALKAVGSKAATTPTAKKASKKTKS